MAQPMSYDDPEHSNTAQSGALPFPWLDPSIATGEFDFGIMDSPAAMDNGLSLSVAAPTNLVGAGTQLGPHQQPHPPVPLYPFQGQSNSLPPIGGPSIAPFACNAPPQNPSYLPDPWFMQSLGASSSNPYGTPAPRQFPQYYPQPAPFPQWSAPAAWTPYSQCDGSSLSWNGQYHTSAMAAAPPLSMGNIQGPGPMTAPSSSMAPRTGTKRWISAELAEHGGPDLTTSKYARLAGQPSRTNEGHMKRSPLGEITADAQNTNLVATSRSAEPEYMRPIAGKKRGNRTKQSGAAASPAGIPIRTTGGFTFAPVHVISLEEGNVASPDQKQPTPTSTSSSSTEPAVLNALGLSNVPAPVTADEPACVVEETAVALTASSSPKPQSTVPAAVVSGRVRYIVPLPACDCPGCISETATTEPIDEASGARDGGVVSDSLESVVAQAVTPADEEALPVVSDEDAFLFRDLFPDVTGPDTATESATECEPSSTAGLTTSSPSSQPSAGSNNESSPILNDKEADSFPELVPDVIDVDAWAASEAIILAGSTTGSSGSGSSATSSVPSGECAIASGSVPAANPAGANKKFKFTAEQEAVLRESFDKSGNGRLVFDETTRLTTLLGCTVKNVKDWYAKTRKSRKSPQQDLTPVVPHTVQGFIQQLPDANGRFTAEKKVRLGRGEPVNTTYETRAA